jgi:hypothetical protein
MVTVTFDGFYNFPSIFHFWRPMDVVDYQTVSFVIESNKSK